MDEYDQHKLVNALRRRGFRVTANEDGAFFCRHGDYFIVAHATYAENPEGLALSRTHFERVLEPPRPPRRDYRGGSR